MASLQNSLQPSFVGIKGRTEVLCVWSKQFMNQSILILLMLEAFV